MRIGSLIIFQLSKLWKAKFFILCDIIFLVRLQEKFEIDDSGSERVNVDSLVLGLIRKEPLLPIESESPMKLSE